MTPLDRTRAILSDLIAWPTVSADSNLDMIAHIANLLSDLGARVDVMADDSGTKANLFATLGPEGDGGLVLSGHTDVVPVTDQEWTTDPFRAVEREGRIYGRGSCDMKGFIAAVLAMAPDFATAPLRRPLHFAFTYDEEVGCIGGRALVEQLKARGIRPAMAIVGEPTGMQVIEGHKGCCEYTVRFHGLEGHGSAPDRGVNALEYATAYVSHLLSLRAQLRERTPPDNRFDPPWTTINIGRLSGGVAHNVIASRAELDWEMRPVQDSDRLFVKREMARCCTEDLLPEMRATFPEAMIETLVVGEVPGLEPMPENDARDLVMALTGENDAGLVAYGTEAGLFQEMGMSVVICGPGHIEQAHKADEFVSIAELEKCLAFLDRLKDSLEQYGRRQ